MVVFQGHFVVHCGLVRHLWQWRWLCYVVLCCIALYFILLYFIKIYCIVFYTNLLYCIQLHCIASRCIARHQHVGRLEEIAEGVVEKIQ